MQVEHCTGITEVMRSTPIQAWIFFLGLIFTTAQAVFIIANIAFIFTSLCAVHVYNFHIFTVIYSSLHGFTLNQHNDQLPVGLSAQLVEHCIGIAKVMNSSPVQAWFFFFFSGLIFNTAQVVFITAKIAFIFPSLSAVQYVIFIYSQSIIPQS